MRSPEKVTTVGEYDAVVLGSAVYTGHWMKASVELVDVAELVARTGAREHRVFTGLDVDDVVPEGLSGR